MAEEKNIWKYDAGEHRVKHCWNQPYADVLQEGVRFVGKCPNTLSKELARELLVDAEYEGKGESETPSTGQLQPKRMWNVYEGVVYEAVPTQTGSYHGYPWCGRPGMNRLPRRVYAALATKAAAQGFEREFKAWVKRHG